MPLSARLVVAAYVGLYLLLCATLLTAAALLIPFSWMSWILAALLLALTVILLDAFHPKVSLFIPSLWKIPQQPGAKTIALTFDDGPVHPYTGHILDVLDLYGVKASFFCIGENVRQNPELALEIARRGHTLGNHTQTHGNLLLATSDRITRELEEAQQTIGQSCGIEPRFFRCPKGYKSPLVARVLRRRRLDLVAYGYPVWDVQNPPATELVDRVLNRAAAGDIVVMHDGYAPGKPGKRDSLVAALPGIIEGLLARDITPVSLDQAIGKKQ
jgi:peptidoglycan/xylan/chitin deacetylase (PgdA/CDA1 family)